MNIGHLGLIMRVYEVEMCHRTRPGPILCYVATFGDSDRMRKIHADVVLPVYEPWEIAAYQYIGIGGET